jgi:hypothetical protein
MRSGKICGVAGQFAMFVSLGDASCGQQGSGSRAQLAIAAGDPPVFVRTRTRTRIRLRTRNSICVSGCAGAGGKRLPSCPFAKRTNFGSCLDQLQPSSSILLRVCNLTLHQHASFLQVRNEICLCTSCEGVTGVVENGGETSGRWSVVSGQSKAFLFRVFF